MALPKMKPCISELGTAVRKGTAVMTLICNKFHSLKIRGSVVLSRLRTIAVDCRVIMTPESTSKEHHSDSDRIRIGRSTSLCQSDKIRIIIHILFWIIGNYRFGYFWILLTRNDF